MKAIFLPALQDGGRLSTLPKKGILQLSKSQIELTQVKPMLIPYATTTELKDFGRQRKFGATKVGTKNQLLIKFSLRSILEQF